MKNKLVMRIILDFVLFGSAMTGALWIIFPVGIICVWYYKKFYEFPLAAFAFDVIYGVSGNKFFGFGYIYSLVAIILFIIISILKSKIRKDLWQKSF